MKIWETIKAFGNSEIGGSLIADLGTYLVTGQNKLRSLLTGTILKKFSGVIPAEHQGQVATLIAEQGGRNLNDEAIMVRVLPAARHFAELRGDRALVAQVDRLKDEINNLRPGPKTRFRVSIGLEGDRSAQIQAILRIARTGDIAGYIAASGVTDSTPLENAKSWLSNDFAPSIDAEFAPRAQALEALRATRNQQRQQRRSFLELLRSLFNPFS